MKQAVMHGGAQSMDAARAALPEVAGPEGGRKLYPLSLHDFSMILSGCGILRLMHEAEKQKHESMHAVV